MPVDHTAAIVDLERALAAETGNLNWLYAAIDRTPQDTVIWIDLTMRFLPATHEAINETKLLIAKHQAALKGAQQ